MMDYLKLLFEVQNLVTLLVAAAAFATVLTIAMPFFENDKLSSRTKMVSSERERLRAAQKAALEAGSSVVRLREKQASSLFAQIVQMLNLRTVFDTETTREKLRTAGWRSERHVTVFLAMRVIVPILLALGMFAYLTMHMATKFSVGPRVAFSLMGLIIGSYIPNIFVGNAAKKRQAKVKSGWSDALDLMLICIESGMSLEAAMARVAKEIGSQSVPLAEELQLTVAELAYLPDRKKALENLAKRTGLETVKSVVTAMIQSERYGTPLGTALRVLAEENRKDRMSEAEKKAAALPPKLTVPMILFFLPVIFVVLLGPAAIKIMDAMHGHH